MAKTNYTRNGGRTVELFLPFDFQGNKYEKIEFSPIKFDHTLRWKDNQFPTMLSLMAEVAGLSEEVLRQIAYPDADRVMSAFVDMLPPEIRESISAAQPIAEPIIEPDVPIAEAPVEPPQPIKTNGVGAQSPSTPVSPFPSSTPSDDTGLGVDLGE